MPEPVTGPDEFLRLLREAKVPVSKTGESEILIGRGACKQLDLGRSPDDVATELSKAVPIWTPVQARRLVDAAVATLCSTP